MRGARRRALSSDQVRVRLLPGTIQGRRRHDLDLLCCLRRTSSDLAGLILERQLLIERARGTLTSRVTLQALLAGH